MYVVCACVCLCMWYACVCACMYVSTRVSTCVFLFASGEVVWFVWRLLRDLLSNFVITIVLYVPCGGRKKSPRTYDQYCYYPSCRSVVHFVQPCPLALPLHHVVGHVCTDVRLNLVLYQFKPIVDAYVTVHKL